MERPLQQGADAHPTIVSLNPCADAILAEFAPPSQLLALSHYSRDPSASSMDVKRARDYGITGGTVEEVLALNPDMVVASTFIQPATRAAFDDLGIAVETVGIASTPEESIAQIRQLASAAGRERSGERLIERIETAFAKSVASKGSAPFTAVLWQPGGIVPGEGALATRLMEHTGLTSHSAALGLHQADYLSLERLLTGPPDILLIAGNERGQGHPALSEVSDMRTERFDPALLWCGGPSMIGALERLTQVRDRASRSVRY